MSARLIGWATFGFFAWIAISPASAEPAPPGASPLAIVPSQAPIVIQVRGVERTKGRLSTMLKAALPDLGALAAMQIDKALKDSLEGRKLQGLEKDGPIFVVFLEMPSPDADPPVMAVIARVSSYAAFRDGLLADDERQALKKVADGSEQTTVMGKDLFFLERTGWAIVSPNKDAMALLAKDNPGLNTRIGAELNRKLTESDVAAYVNLSAVNKQFGDNIREAKDTFFGLLDQFGNQDRSTMEMVKSIYGGVFQVIEDGKGLVLAIDFRPEGLSVQLAAQIGAETPTNKFLKSQKPSPLKQIGTLPGSQVVYSATEMTPALVKALGPLMYGAAGDGEGKEELQKAMNELISAGNATSISAGRFPMVALQATTYQDPAKATAAMLALFRAMGDGVTFQSAAIKGKPVIKENAESYRNFKFNYIKLTWDFDKLAEQVPGGGDEIKAAMKKFMGEGAEIWFGTDGKQFLQVTAKSWDEAKTIIDSFLDGKTPVSDDSAFQLTRKQLPADANMLVLADAAKFTLSMGDYVLSIMRNVPGLPINLPPNMKEVKTANSFLGMSVVMQPENGSAQFFLPVTAVQEMRKVLMPLFMGGE